MSERLLIVDSHSNEAEKLSQYLQKEGFVVDCAYSFEQGLNAYSSYFHDFAIIEIELPDGDGIELANKIKSLNPDAKVILTTSYPSITTALKALKLKAEDYLIKPFVYEEIKASLMGLIKIPKREQKKERPFSYNDKEGEICSIIGESSEIKLLLEKIKKIANTPTNVLLLGETGTGKELFARAIHEASYRRKKSFVAINCANLPENLLESELFGYQKGAFTGAVSDKKGLIEIADGGTVFLDEIGDMPLSLQAKLLRVLEDKEVRPLGSTISKKIDVRIISATNKDLLDEVKKGKFREDLFFRLNVVTFKIPPLRERGKDIELLAYHFMRKIALRMGKNLKKIHPEALKRFYNYPWPGNIRELQNVIEQAVIFAEEDTIMPEHLPEHIQNPEKFFGKPQDIPLLSIEEYTKEFILKYQSVYTEQELADILGITRKALWEKRKKWGITKK
ncbi:sigma-54-dependent transcriptional regulator [Thermodesulfovibrio hydrogeniphilus]